jgi:hypothetical protein
MFNGKSQAPWPGRAHHEPIPSLGKKVGRVVVTELRVIGLVIVPTNPLLRHPGGASGLEYIERPAFKRLGDKSTGILFPKNLIIKVWKFLDIREARHLPPRVESQAGGSF